MNPTTLASQNIAAIGTFLTLTTDGYFGISRSPSRDLQQLVERALTDAMTARTLLRSVSASVALSSSNAAPSIKMH